jgi:hypothetical protein
MEYLACDVIFMKENIVQLAHINHFSALLTFIEVPLLLFA